MTSGFTCVTCHVVFTDPVAHKAHFQTDWHRFNIHRNLENEQPVTEQVFLDRVVPVVKSRQEAKRAAAATHICELCKKQFSSEAALKNHMNSRKHRENSQDMISENDQDLEAKVQEKLSQLYLIDPKVECIFCSSKFPHFEAVMQHMTQVHSLFIPDLEYLNDLPGLVKFLADKVSLEFKCLYCSSVDGPSHFHSLAAARKHMIDRSHTKIRFDEEGCSEIAPFYNWQEFYSDASDEEEWEEVSEEGSSTAAPSRSQKQLLISPDGSEMLLPNGAFIGNRKLRYIYNQHLRVLESDTEEGSEDESEHVVGNLIRDYRQRGQLTALVPAQRKLLKLSQRNKDIVQKDESLRLAVKANKFQPYYRAQIR
jgi:pre-60S factor REI1